LWRILYIFVVFEALSFIDDWLKIARFTAVLRKREAFTGDFAYPGIPGTVLANNPQGGTHEK
jgi:hypothetical protein